jgi:hypothetical protein
MCSASILMLGCDRKSEDVEAVSTSAHGLLRYVPADTPYVFALVEPFPEDIADKLEPKLEKILGSYRDLLTVLAEAAAKADSGSDDADVLPENVAEIVSELAGLLSVDGLRSAGIDRESTMVLYGAGLLPVMRMTVSDGALLEATIARIEEKASDRMSVATIDGQSYRYAGDEKGRLIIAVIGNEFVLSIVPTNLSEELLKSVLGMTLPASSIADTGELQTIIADNGFLNHSVGLIDVERIAATFLDDQSGLNAELLRLMDYDVSALDDVCKSEIRAMSGVVPRLITGYTEISVDEFVSNTIVEVRSDIAAGLATLAAPVPGLGSDQSGLVAFGMSIDLLAAREFYAARLDALEAEPYECELFAELQDGVEAGRQALEQPIPPIAYGFKGFLAVIEDIQGMDLSKNQPPTSADVRLLVAADNAAGLLAMGAMFSPEIAALEIQPDGEPVRFESPQLNGVVDAAYVAMTEDALAISVGQGTEARLAGMLAAAINQPHPFMSMEMDAGRYYSFIADTMVLEDDENPTPAELKAAMARMMTTVGDMFSRMTFRVEFTERGIEFPSTIVLAD